MASVYGVNPSVPGAEVAKMFPLTALRGGVVTPPVVQKPVYPGTTTRDFKPVNTGVTPFNYQANTPFSQNNNTVEGSLNYVKPTTPTPAGLSYIGSHLIYVVVFIILTVVMFYTVGKKSTTYFLLLVLLGQLVIGYQGVGDALKSVGLGGTAQ